MLYTVFVSFDFDNDRRYKYLLEAWNKNPRFTFTFKDGTPNEIQTWDIGRIKAGLTRKINEATHTLIIVGAEANKLHRDHALIGYRNWINFEIAKSKENGNRLVGVKLEPHYESPEELRNSGANWAYAFTEQSILKALQNAY